MNTQHPHEILPEDVLRKMPPELRRTFVPLPVHDVERVRAMTPEERARYLDEHPSDKLRLERAVLKRLERARRKLAREFRVTSPTLEGLDLAASIRTQEH